ncbi:MAG: trigger factor [Fimbriimonas sp.]
MQITREDLNPCTIKLSVVCSPEQVSDAFDRALKAISKEVRLPGFRPGHAPKHMVEKMVSKDELYNQAADELVRRTYEKALKDQNIEPDPGVRPSVELEELDREAKTATYSAKVPLPPKIELSEYKGLPANRPAIEVTDEEVQYQITELRKRQGSREAVLDRNAQEGDYGVVNIKVEGEAGEGRTFMVVIGQTFPSLDAALPGMASEEMRSVELEFPDNFSDKALAGTKQKSQITLNSISAVSMPELNDEFAKALNSDSVEELTARMRESIVQAKEQMTRDMVQDQLLESLRGSSKIEVSDNMWEALANQRLSEISQEVRRQGKTIEDYAKENGMTVEELVKAWHEQAKVHVERAMVVREVFAKEKLAITNEELNTELFSMAQEYQMEPMELLEAMRKAGSLQELQFRAISRKVTDFLIENAVISETAEVSGSEKSAKKSTKAKPAKEAEVATEEEAPKKKATKKKSE